METITQIEKSNSELAYQSPPKIISDLIDGEPTPAISLSPSGKWMIFFARPNLPPIEEVAQEEIRLAGIRINPKTNGSSRAGHYNGIILKLTEIQQEIPIRGLPVSLKIQNLSWSPDGSKIAFTNTLTDGIELWVVDIKTANAKKFTEAILNDAMSGQPYKWLFDSHTIIYKTIPTERGTPPAKQEVPTGPVIQENDGSSAPVRTYQDLLQNAYDEALFEYYTKSTLMILDLDSAKSKPFGLSGIINGFEPSPDGRYILISMTQKPFSYLVPHGRFPFSIAIYSTKGILIHKLADIPLSENIPKGFGATRKGPRSFTWRTDVPATLYWVEAQDDGDPKKEVAIRDILYCLKAPFDGQQEEQISFPLRYGGIKWGDGDLALAYEWQWANRQEVTNMWKPDQPKNSKKILFDRSWEDRYNNPGSFSVKRNQYGRGVLRKDADGKTYYLTGAGASPEGNKPFIDKFDIATKKTTRLWQSVAPFYEYPIRILDEQKGIFMTRKESKKIPPNFYFRNFNTKENKQITFFKNPYEVLKGIEKQLIKYKRADGVELTGDLYLPANYDPKKDGPLPVIMWAYPKEYKSSDAAGQVQNSPYEFLRLYSGSPIYWVTQGYAVFDDFGMPIIGEGDEEPNETFIQQLVAGAKAAIDKLEEMGVGDPKRVAVGGHSYGAFMTANLLAHSNLFAAGIARSGAYNRTLTPFGFQSEERTLWETPDTYVKMSPFMFADKIKTPLLMIHGEADNNSGTYPMQSKRFYNALKGHGATVRLVMLPHESHGYRARESVMHMLWETHSWLEKYVKKLEV